MKSFCFNLKQGKYFLFFLQNAQGCDISASLCDQLKHLYTGYGGFLQKEKKKCYS